ncbi:hypothetical protein KL912_002729 [Ogataea haglerorum]|nr:hypothetical protein KL923_002831 [Ogataea haglerorum]KAG7748052.1 hypothetical protein KL912_002729 [Ogataea haglerorum]
MKRCLGTTAKGERCKIILKQEAYCKYHINQGAGPNDKAGYVYIFTLKHLIEGSPKKQTWLRQADPNPENQINFEHTSVFDPKRHILIKVGYTTQRVRRRLSQWRERCKQDFQLLTPQTLDRVVSSNRDKLADLMERLSCLSLRSYKKYDFNEQAFKALNAFGSEQQVHAQLRSLFGSGRLYCDGCKSANSGVHKEWFLVPRKKVRNIMRMIDRLVD